MFKKTGNENLSNFLRILFLFVFLIFSAYLASDSNNFVLGNTAKQPLIRKLVLIPTDTPTPTPTPIPTDTPTPVPAKQQSQPLESSADETGSQWGVAKQISDHEWTLQVSNDDHMATPQEILDALNNYRGKHGSGSLSWDTNLANFAQNRATYFNQIQNLDDHKGFTDFVSNPANLKQINFYHLGENSSYGFQLIGVHLIEWVFASDAGHNDNQLNPVWTHVGIGVSGTGVDIVFAQ